MNLETEFFRSRLKKLTKKNSELQNRITQLEYKSNEIKYRLKKPNKRKYIIIIIKISKNKIKKKKIID